MLLIFIFKDWSRSPYILRGPGKRSATDVVDNEAKEAKIARALETQDLFPEPPVSEMTCILYKRSCWKLQEFIILGKSVFNFS